MKIEVHPTDPPLGADELEHLASVLPDPATTVREQVAVPITRFERVVLSRDLVELPNDAGGLPLPGELVPTVVTWRFERRFKPDRTPFWYRLP